MIFWLKRLKFLIQDDEDFEFNYLLDRHLEMSYLIVDELHGQMPNFVDTQLSKLPHTFASVKIQDKAPRSHVRSVCISPSEMETFSLAIARARQGAQTAPGAEAPDFRDGSESGSFPGSRKVSKESHLMGAADRFFSRVAHLRRIDRPSAEASITVRVVQEDHSSKSSIDTSEHAKRPGDL